MTHHAPISISQKNLGIFWGFIGVACFSFTMPMAKLALDSFEPWFLSFGRSCIAALISLAIIAYKGKLGLIRTHWRELIGISLGIALGFPLLTSIALSHTSSSHAGIVLAILPLMTAIVGAIIYRQRHGTAFWATAVAGCATVLAYVCIRSSITLELADVLLLGAAVSASIGYAFGARLTRHMSGLDVICCALIMMLPVSLPAALYLGISHPATIIQPAPMVAFIYITLISQLFGFVPWYKGLAMGGVGVVSQVQLLQVFMTLIISAVMLHEVIGVAEFAVAGLVVFQIYLARKFA